MLKGAVLFNGLRFPFAVIDHAFDWAKNEGAKLHAIFLIAKDTESEGYFFPSDLDAAEDLTSDADSFTDNQKVIASNLRMLRNRAQSEQIDFHTIVLYDPSNETLLTTIQSWDKIFISDESSETSVPGYVDINLHKQLSTVEDRVVRVSP